MNTIFYYLSYYNYFVFGKNDTGRASRTRAPRNISDKIIVPRVRKLKSKFFTRRPCKFSKINHSSNFCVFVFRVVTSAHDE